MSYVNALWRLCSCVTDDEASWVFLPAFLYFSKGSALWSCGWFCLGLKVIIKTFVERKSSNGEYVVCARI